MALDPTTKAAIQAAVTPIATMATTTMLTAAESGAQALRTKAGASDIEAKLLKIT